MSEAEETETLQTGGARPAKPVYIAPGAIPQNPLSVLINENCAVKSAVSVVFGGVLGFFFGFLFSPTTYTTNPELAAKATTRQQIVTHFRDVGKQGVRSAKGFSMAAGIFTYVVTRLSLLLLQV